ncbi:cobalamin B12-binding domain-containing protein [Candidatus Microgenomates bacterium]|nr:cobalamin B12-binding domain-containing protein [Candidatus Microgenomates bacterium]
MPLGILYVASALEAAGHEVQVFDPFFEDWSFLKKVKVFKPDLIGLSILTATYDRAKKMSRIFRHELPDALICAGGIHPTALPERTLEDLNLDFIVYGEGESTIREVCQKLGKGKGLENVKGVVYKKNGVIIKNPPRELIQNIDEIPFPNRDLIDVENYLIPPGYIRSYILARTLTIYTSRGCPAVCTFCSSHLLFGRKNRRRSVKNVLEEMRLLKEKYHIDGVYFMDDTFATDKNWVMDFCRQKRKEKMDLIWGCQTRVTSVSEKLLKMMRKAGCVQVDFGVESGSERVLTNLKKGQRPKDIRRAFKLAKRAKLRTFATLILGSPAEKLEDIKETERLIKEIAPSYTHISFCTPLPGTELYEQALKMGWVQPSFGNRWDFIKSDSPIMTINLSSEDLVAARSHLHNSLFWQNYRYVFYPKNIPFLLGVIWASILDLQELIKAFKRFLKTKNTEDLVHFVLYAYRRREMTQKTNALRK